MLICVDRDVNFKSISFTNQIELLSRIQSIQRKVDPFLTHLLLPELLKQVFFLANLCFFANVDRMADLQLLALIQKSHV